MEVFVSIKGYENYYEISNYGRVRSLYNRYKMCEFKKPYTRKDGYVVANLIKDGKQTTFYLHRLVANHFIENDDINMTEINHIDGDKQNNHVDNLEWCTSQQNIIHSYKSNLSKIGFNRTSSKLTEEMVFKIPSLLKDGYSIKQISKLFNVSTTAIHHVLKGDNYGFLGIDFGYTFKKYNKKDNTEISDEIKNSTPS